MSDDSGERNRAVEGDQQSPGDVRAWDTAGQRGREVAMETDCDSVTRTRRPMGQRRRREADIHKDPSFRLRPLGEYITNGANK